MKVVVIGGGPAGMMAGIRSAEQGNQVIIIEKTSSLGRKLLITGKGRCNITSSLDMDEFIKNTPGNGRFLYSSYQRYTNKDIIDFLKEQGLEVKEERGNRIFPVTDKSVDVLKCFTKKIKELNIKVEYETIAEDILVNRIVKNASNPKNTDDLKNIGNSENTGDLKNIGNSKNDSNDENNELYIIGVKTNKGKIDANKVILATGGKSYPLTGSTGDGYNLAKKLGHTITKIRPSLVPLETYETKVCKDLQGLSLRNVKIQFKDIEKNKTIYDDFGEMIFTHFGVSGPIILSGSAHLVRYKNIEEKLANRKIVLKIDFKPALSEEKLEARIMRDFEKQKNKQFKNSLDELLPQKLIPVMVEKSGIEPDKKVNEITKEKRRNLVKLLKDFELEIKGFRPIDEAIITSGGISTKEIDPKTMESKIVKGLYFAGEIIDVDSYTGGFNLQIAYSTGYVAGSEKGE